MFYIVETDSSVERLKNICKSGCYVDIIPSNDLFHPKLTYTVAVYIRPIIDDEGFIIPISHDEGVNIDKNRVLQVLSEIETLYTLDKKLLLYHFNLQQAIDVSLLYSMVKFEKLAVSRENSTINHYYHKFRTFKNVNSLIPITKLYESCEKVFDKVKFILDYDIPSGFDFYNKTATNVFFLLEQAGLGVNYNAYVEMFKPREPLYNTIDNTTLTYYNLYNVTSRPTNAFNSVNFAAIPKTKEHRQCFKPKGDYFVELDFDGYHLRLLCEQIDYDLTSDSAHKQLARQYFGKEEITEEEYDKAKQINFHAIYGKIPEKYSDLPIFTKIDSYIKELWQRYEKDGKVLAPISGKPFTKSLKDMHPQKLMNYIMQSLETSRNILILKDVLRYLKDKKSKLVLYTYDALLFDFYKEDGEETLNELKEILESNGKYPIKHKYSKDLVL